MVAGKIFCVVLTPPYVSRRARPRHGHGSGPLHNLTSRRRQEIKMERRYYPNPLSRYLGIHLQEEYNPSESDSSTVADHDDDISSLSSMGASPSPLSSTLPSSHSQPQSNSSETPQCATTRSDRAMQTPETSRLFKQRKLNTSGNQSCLAHLVWNTLPDEHRTD